LLSRIEQVRFDLEDPTYEPDLPPVEDAEFILDYLWGAGPVTGQSVLTHAEILAWQQNTGVELEPWQISFLRRLSNEYLVEAALATDANRQPPWKHEADPRASANALKRSMRKLAAL
jgi:hypothetical protein